MGSARLELLRGGAGVEGAQEADTARDGGAGGTQRVRIVDAATGCISRQGVGRTTLDDVAREAGCSRATVYRTFPGGKDEVLRAVVDTEVSRLFSAIAVEMGHARDIETVLVSGITEAARRVSDHRALAYLMEHEPEVVLPHLCFSRMDSVLEVCSSFTAPFLGRWLGHDEAHRVAEWAARIVLSYLACPAEGVVLTDTDSVRHLVRTFIVPGVDLTRYAEDSSPRPRPSAPSRPSRPSQASRRSRTSQPSRPGKGEAR